ALPIFGDVMETLAGGFQNFRHARIWGPSADFDDQKVGEDHVLEDEDVVELKTG
ncbi:MAG: TGS domain-containing protein, partial [Candidatus Nanohaloarchaea archaeon]